MMINKAILNIEIVDEESGEITIKEFDVANLISSALSKKTSTKKKSSSSKIEENDTPIVRLEDNKYVLTSGALNMLGAEPGETRLVIRFQKIGSFTVPIIGTSETFGIKSGNKLTLGGSVSCRGKANDDLSEYGNEFILVPHPSAEGMFIMTQDGVLPEGDYTVKKSTTKKETPKKEFPQPEEEDFPEDMDDLDSLLEDDDDFSL